MNSNLHAVSVYKPTRAIVLFAVMTGTAMAAVEIDFADGRKETFVSASVENGKLKEWRHDLIECPQSLKAAQFFIHIPAGYDGAQPSGLEDTQR